MSELLRSVVNVLFPCCIRTQIRNTQTPQGDITISAIHERNPIAQETNSSRRSAPEVSSVVLSGMKMVNETQAAPDESPGPTPLRNFEARKILKIFPEDDQHLPPSEVLKQREYVGGRAIPSSLASSSCLELGTSRLLDTLNDILSTSYTLDDASVAPLLEMCLERGFDFGTAYAYLRPRWRSDDKDLRHPEDHDRKRRTEATGNKNQIINPSIRPRRVWDLFSNRVIPHWVAATEFSSRNVEFYCTISPVSHAWMNHNHLHFVDTDINSHEWPVPIPNDTSLDRIRVELLNNNLEYAWLDVLCLRQIGPPENEDVRKQEWLLDVPTIGNVYSGAYSCSTVHFYYNGLGRPFEVGDLDSDRHWLNRAWTLQEVLLSATTLGVTERSPGPENVEQDPLVKTFYNKIRDLQEILSKIPVDGLLVVDIMRQRHATSELDKISGLAYLLWSEVLPGYVSNQDPETAWCRVVETMKDLYRGQFLFLYPASGDREHTCWPSWQQLMQLDIPKMQELLPSNFVQYNGDEETYTYEGSSIDETKCRVEGLVDGTLPDRKGWILLAAEGKQARIQITAPHSQPIPDNYYTLLVNNWDFKYWVLGKSASGRFKKVSVVRTSSDIPQPILNDNHVLLAPDILFNYKRNKSRVNDEEHVFNTSLVDTFVYQREFILG